MTCGPVCSCRGSAMLRDDGLGEGRAGALRAGGCSWSGGRRVAPPPGSSLVREAVKAARCACAGVPPSRAIDVSVVRRFVGFALPGSVAATTAGRESRPCSAGPLSPALASACRSTRGWLSRATATRGGRGVADGTTHGLKPQLALVFDATIWGFTGCPSFIGPLAEDASSNEVSGLRKQTAAAHSTAPIAAIPQVV
jgi:hypothetical protein